MGKHGGDSVYENRTVAFIDILGFTELVANSRIRTILKSLEVIRDQRVRLIQNAGRAAIQISQFSDCLILSTRGPSGLSYLVHFSSLLSSELMLNGILCRGAITSGLMYHKRSELFGPALIEAIDIERKLAIYPRVLITESVAEQFIHFKNRKRNPRRRRDISAYFRRDFDHQLHLDVFSPLMFVPHQAGSISKAIKPVHKYVLNHIDVTENVSTKKIQAKLFWLSKYLAYVDKYHGAVNFLMGEKNK